MNVTRDDVFDGVKEWRMALADDAFPLDALGAMTDMAAAVVAAGLDCGAIDREKAKGLIGLMSDGFATRLMQYAIARGVSRVGVAQAVMSAAGDPVDGERCPYPVGAEV